MIFPVHFILYFFSQFTLKIKNKKKWPFISSGMDGLKVTVYCIKFPCEKFEPKSHFKSRLSLIVRVNVVLNRTVVVGSD